jgi:DNA-binding response OmpR family regulator
MANIDEQPSRQACRKETLLLVMHDLPSGLRLLTALLHKTPYDVFLATERFQVVDFLKYLTPLLMICEYQLPGMNGIELFDLLHAQEKFAALPVVLLSNGDPRLEEELGRRKLAWLRQPFTLDELLARMQHVLA